MGSLGLLVPLFRDLSIDEVVALARVAEASNFSTCWYADERFERDPYAILASVACSTTAIKLGPAVTDPFSRHPALTASAIASLDEASGGRGRLGFGAGIAGLDKLHIEVRKPGTAVREAVHVIRKLLAGELTTLEGDSFRIRDGELRFAARPDIEIAVAAEGPRMTEVAGEVADSLIVAHTASAQGIRLRKAAAGQAHRALEEPLRVIARLDVTVHPDSGLARDHARVRVGRVLWSHYPRMKPLADLGIALPPELELRLREAGQFVRTHDLTAFTRFADAIPDEILDLIAVAGTPADVTAHFRRLFQAGVDELMVHPLVPPGSTLPDVVAEVGKAFGQAVSTQGLT
jgi:5,10-methylenetetrahydromethanopterin reductase